MLLLSFHERDGGTVAAAAVAAADVSPIGTAGRYRTTYRRRSGIDGYGHGNDNADGSIPFFLEPPLFRIDIYRYISISISISIECRNTPNERRCGREALATTVVLVLALVLVLVLVPGTVIAGE